MSTSIFILLVVQIILIILNAVFASAEIAVLSMNETKLERMAEQGNGRAKRLVRLTQEPARFLATIQVAITLSGFLGSAFAADNFSEPLVDWVVGIGSEYSTFYFRYHSCYIDYIDFIIFHVGFWRISSKENRNEKI